MARQIPQVISIALHGVAGSVVLGLVGVGAMRVLGRVLPGTSLGLLAGAGLVCGAALGHSRRLLTALRRTRRGQAEAIRRTAQLNARLAERIDAQDALIDSSRRQLAAAQSRAMAQTLAAGVLHDLSNMLTLVSAASDELLGAREPARREAAASDLSQGLHQAFELLRSYRGIVNGHARDGEVAVRASLEELLPLLDRVFAPEQSLALHWEGPAEVVVAMPKHEFAQVVANLVLNGRDALGDEEGRVEVQAGVERGQLVVCVRDNGQGMGDEVRRRAFEPFFTTKQHQNGSGLGLHVLRELVRSAGGGVELRSTVGEGTEVLARLPISRELQPRRSVVA